MRRFTLGFSLADQSLRRSKSIGILNVSLGLLPALAARPEFAEVTAFSNASLALPPDLRVEFHDAVAAGGCARIWWDQFGVYRAAQKAGCHWLFLPKGFASFLVRPPVRLAAYIHDAMHDFYYTHYPGGSAGLERWYFARSYEAALRRADIVFTNTAFTAGEVNRMAAKLTLPPPRTIVAGIGFKPLPPVAPKEDLIVVPVSPWPHKLSAQTLEYLSRWQTARSYAGQIHFVGGLPPRVALPSFAHWRHLPRLDTPEFEQLLARSRVVVYFSAYEGFGMPPIEAIMRGAAPAYSNIPAMMETCAGCGFPFPNGDYQAFAAALDAALACPPAQIEDWSKTLARRHSWADAAERIASALADPRV